MPTLTCLHCHVADSLPRSLLGREVRCGACGKTMTAPAARAANPTPHVALGLILGMIAVVGPWRMYRVLKPIPPAPAPIMVAEPGPIAVIPAFQPKPVIPILTPPPAPVAVEPPPPGTPDPWGDFLIGVVGGRHPIGEPVDASFRGNLARDRFRGQDAGPGQPADRPNLPGDVGDPGGTNPRPPSDFDGPERDNCAQVAAMARPARTVEPGRFPVGARARAVRAGSTGDVAIATDPRAINILRSPFQAERLTYGQGPWYFRVAAGTRVEVLDSQRPASLVRVVEGAHQGQEGWLADEWIQPLPDPNAVKGRAASLLTMARNLDKAGRRKQAAEAYARVVGECPGTPEAELAEAAASALAGILIKDAPVTSEAKKAQDHFDAMTGRRVK